MRTALIQVDITPGNVTANLTKAITLMTKGVAEGATLFVLPELWTTGYKLRSIDKLAETEEGPTLTRLRQFAADHHVEIISGSIAELADNNIYNTTYAINSSGTIVAKYRKLHLFSLMDEHRYFTAGNSKGIANMSFGKAGLIICYDLRFTELTRSLALAGCNTLFVPAEWPTIRGSHWLNLNIARAIENQLFVIAVNCVGRYGNSTFFGNSLVINPWGEIITQGSSTAEQVIVTNIDFSLVDEARNKIPIFTDRRPEYY
ncbi:MAG: carbon-nitrogen hydrolase [Firmicutes bacterium]|nr:carbon-nitrogen hydrolase [Bacillota bacterium]